MGKAETTSGFAEEGAPFLGQPSHGTTMAAEGLPRLAFTVDDVYRMVEAGILHEDERVELIDGELVVMSPKGNRHEVVKAYLLEHLILHKPSWAILIPETTFRLSPTTYLEPDITVYSRLDGLANLKGDNALLVIEIADSSLAYDRGHKARLYARFGIRELWVIDAVKLTTYIHFEPGEDGYAAIIEKQSNEELVPKFAPELAVTLGKLDLR